MHRLGVVWVMMIVFPLYKNSGVKYREEIYFNGTLLLDVESNMLKHYKGNVVLENNKYKW
jgi:hypothetical protein